ncbi:threonine/serine dehydratase [Marisediminicola senii]|uniref:threonine/serine dehydratase n=1 Tax=Marisediminicola senii TaxID=2711233 RepID=UPI0013EA53A8|nr:threonine/serine dehydratase [Marisediminicola senii]
MTVTTADVSSAHARIRQHVRRTPVARLDVAGHDDVWAKLEFVQHTGTFKARGAFNRILASQESGLLDPAVGIAVASGGNAGLANSYAARELGVPATVFVPEAAPRVKVERLRSYGATVVLGGSEYAEAYLAAMEFVAETGALYCHAYDQPEIVAGAGTLGLELLEQTDGAVDTVLVAVGGGGLMAGVAAAVEGRARVVGVEPENAPTLHTALASGAPTDVAVSGVAADSLGARRIGEAGFAVATRAGVLGMLVSDDEIVAARRWAWENWRIALEHGASTPIAALLSGVYVPQPGERVALVLCGSNTDPSDL